MHHPRTVRTLRTLAALALIAMAYGQDSSHESDVDVIIVGAGWSGMAAADHLARANVSFVILEASNYTGGRTHSIEFGNPSVGKFIFDQGSNWVCGIGTIRTDKDAPTVRTNPVFDLLKQEGLGTVVIPGATDGNMSNYFAVFDENGKRTDLTGDLRRKANAALDCLNRTGGNADAKETVRQGLTKCGWSPSTNAEWAMDWALSSDEAGVVARGQALSGFAPDPTYYWWGKDDWFVVDQHPRGFARLIDGMVRDTVPDGDPRLVFNAHVANIAYDCNGVTVSTKDGKTFKGKHAISTVSLGVLKKHHKELFSPPLPKKHTEVLLDNNILMANLTHVLIQFPSVWWDNSLPAWVSANAGGHAAAGNFTVWHNLDVMVPGSHTLLSFLGEPEASKFGTMTEAEIMPILMERLRAQHPSKTIPEASAAWLKNWGSDPLFYGAYSYSAPGASYSSAWKKPLKACKKEVVQFAGEAACDNMNGYTHGALQSGKEAAARYLYKAGKGPNPNSDDALSLCSW